MRRLVVAAALVAAALTSTAVASASSAKVIHKCLPNKAAGIETQDHTTLVVYCGTARATLRAGSTTTHYKGGACFRIPGTLNIGFGKFTTLSHPKPLFSALLFVLPASRDGVYKLGVLQVQRKGKTMSANNVRAVVRGKRSRATFSGKFLIGPKFTGSVTCGK